MGNEKRHRLDRAVTLATAILPRSDAPSAQIPGGAVVFGQHPAFAAVTAREVCVVCRGLRRSRMASGFLQPVDHSTTSRPELAGVGALVARLAQLCLLNHGQPTPLIRSKRPVGLCPSGASTMAFAVRSCSRNRDARRTLYIPPGCWARPGCRSASDAYVPRRRFRLGD